MMFHPVHEGELAEISFLNTLSLAFFSAGSFLLSLAIAFWSNQFFSDNLRAEGKVLATAGAAILLCLSLISFGLGITAIIRRAKQVAKIKSFGTTASVRFSAEGDEVTPPDAANSLSIAAKPGVGQRPR